MQVKSMNKKVERQEEKLLAVLVKQNKNMREKRQQLKKKLACKKLQVKEDLNKVKCAKKRVQLEEALQVKWSEIDHVSQEEKAMARIERNNAIIRTLEREVEILKEKQTCKRMERSLVCTKECKGVLSETIKQCKSTIIMHKHSALDKKINNILTEVNFLRNGVSPKVTSSTNTKDITLQSVAQQKSGPITSGALISSFLGHSSRCQAQTEKYLISQEATTSKEVPPQIVKLEPGFPTSNTVTACLALSLGYSSTSQVQTEQEIMNLEELVPESCEISEHTCGEEETCQDSIDSKSTYSFTFEEDVDSQDEDATDDQMAKINVHSQPPLYSCTRLVSLHKLLPRLLEIIEEETQKDLEDYENETFTCMPTSSSTQAVLRGILETFLTHPCTMSCHKHYTGTYIRTWTPQKMYA